MAPGFVSHVLETKGLLHGFERSAQILVRYSFGRSRFEEMMAGLARDLYPMGVRVTFCVTASLLESHQQFFQRFSGLGHEFAAHGYFHTNMKKKTLDEQCALVARSYSAFEDLRVKVQGFRCPYLSYNDDTMAALSASPFAWTSNNVILWEDPTGCRRTPLRVGRLARLYSTHGHERRISVPSTAGAIVDIPITAPDDEMLFERYRIKDSGAISAIWGRIFRKVHAAGEIFHLLFHPERFRHFAPSMMDIAMEARAACPPVWFATLNDISDWWRRRQASAWSVERRKGTYRVSLRTPKEATVLLKRDRGVDTAIIGGLYGPAPMAVRGGRRFLDTDEPWKHTVHVSRRCPPEVESFLSDEGFMTAPAERPREGALFIGGYDRFGPEHRRALLREVDGSDYPLLRLWRWPGNAQSALTVSSDVDSISVSDFFRRFLYF